MKENERVEYETREEETAPVHFEGMDENGEFTLGTVTWTPCEKTGRFVRRIEEVE